MLIQSPYITSTQEIRVKLPQSTYESATQDPTMHMSDGVITYGPFPSTSPLSSSTPLRIHFPSNAQFRTFDK